MKRFLYYFFFVGIIVSIIMCIEVTFHTPTSIKNIDINSPTARDKNYSGTDKITQYFQSQIDNINSLSIYFNNENKNIKVNIYDGNQLIETVNLKKVKKDQYHTFSVKNMNNIKNKVLKIEIKADKSISLNLNNNYNKNQYLMVNHEKQKASMTFSYIGKSNDNGDIWYFLVSLIVSLLLFIYIKEEIKKKG